MHTMIADTGKSDTAPDIRQFENILRPGELASYGVEWSDCSRATPLGGMAYFGHFLHANGLLDDLVSDCPLDYTSNNAPKPQQVVGTFVCSILKGARRYAHLSQIYGDTLCAETLGIKGGFVSEDSVRRGFRKMTHKQWNACDQWLASKVRATVLPLLTERYILDTGYAVDSTCRNP